MPPSLEPADELNTTDYSAYHFENVVFLVEGQLFKVPRHYFQNDSEVFNGMFSLPTGRAVVDGSSDDQPLRLDGITKFDFLCLLKVLYPMHYGEIELYSVEEWTSVLKLSTMWNFNEIRNLAIREMVSNLSSVEKIVLAQQPEYDIESWLLPAISDLVKRNEPISVAEANKLGIECAVKIAGVREKCNAFLACIIQNVFPGYL